MMDISAIAWVIPALKAASNIMKAMIELRHATAFQAKETELQSKLLAAQSAVFAANDERRQLLGEVDTLKAEVKRLKQLDGGGERCPRCGKSEFRVERSVPSPEFGELGVRDHHMKCAACGFEDVRQNG